MPKGIGYPKSPAHPGDEKSAFEVLLERFRNKKKKKSKGYLESKLGK